MPPWWWDLGWLTFNIGNDDRESSQGIPGGHKRTVGSLTRLGWFDKENYVSPSHIALTLFSPAGCVQAIGVKLAMK